MGAVPTLTTMMMTSTSRTTIESRARFAGASAAAIAA